MEPIPSHRNYERPLGWIVPFFSLHAFAFVSLLVLLVTFSTGRVKRDPTIINLIAVFMTFSGSTALMFISGNLTSSRERIFGLCLANGATVVGGTPAEATAAFVVVLQIFFRIMSAKGHLVRTAESRITTVVLVAAPWIFWLAFIVGSLVVGLQDRSKVYRAVFYCGIDSDELTFATAVVAAIVLVVNLILELVVGIILTRHFLSIRRVRRASTPGLQSAALTSDSKGSAMILGVSVALVIRLGLFGICVFAALVCAFATISDFTSLVADFAVATIAVLAFVIFSSQADVLRAWHLLPPSSTSSTTLLNSQSDEASFRRPGALNQGYPMEYLPRDPDVESLGAEQSDGLNRFVSPDWGGGGKKMASSRVQQLM